MMLLNCSAGEDPWRVPWTARRSNQSILKDISLVCSLEGLMLKLKLQYFGHLMQRADPLEKTLMLGKTEGRRRRDDRGWDGWMASLTQWTWVWVDSGSWWLTARPGVLQFMESPRVRHDWATELNWTNCDWHHNLWRSFAKKIRFLGPTFLILKTDRCNSHAHFTDTVASLW